MRTARTCIGAISGGIPGRIDHPINNRKGCGGVMRAAPAGLISPGAARTKDAVFGTDPAVPAQPDKALNAAIYGAELSALTHGGDLGWLPGAMLAHMVSQLVSGEAESIWDAANNALIAIPYEYTAAPNLQAFTDLRSEAMELADGEMTDLEAIHQLGEGWVGDEAMAIALFCALRHEDDFAAGVIAAVNHKGDSDSTGAIAGNLLGAFLGYDAIPETFQKNLELHDVIVRMADALCERAGKDEEHE